MKRQYRITSARFDVPTKTIESPTFEGKTQKKCDEQAIAHMEKLSNKEENQWERMTVIRIDQVEKTTLIATNGRE